MGVDYLREYAAMATILVVDDSLTERRLMGGWLERNGDFSVAYAADGQEALQWLRENRVDLVLTDMQMPNMNGLELVTAVRSEFPAVPIVLITAHGSADLASRALRKGAASYVPKSRFQDLLVDTVNQILDLSPAAVRSQSSLIDATFCEIHFALANDPAKVAGLVDTVQTIVGSMGVCDATGQLQIGIALEQALLNAIYHGNLEMSDTTDEEKLDREALFQQRINEAPYRDRKVQVQLKVTDAEASIVVRDEGPGFDVRKLTKIPLSTSLVDPSGRGFVLMWALMDKVTFSKTGNQVALVKHRESTVTDTDVAAAKEADRKPPTDTQQRELGQLIPTGSKESIFLPRRRLVIGRHPSCDIVIPNRRVSLRHCLLFVHSGWWYVKCLKETSVIRLNNVTVTQGRLAPGATFVVGDREFKISYDLTELCAVGITPPVDPF